MTKEKIEDMDNFSEIIEYAVKTGVMSASRKYGITYSRLKYYMKTHDISVERDYYFKNKEPMNTLAKRANELSVAKVAAEDGVSKQAVHQRLTNAGFILAYVRKQDVKDLPYIREFENA